KKVVHTEFDELNATRFDLIKANLGLKNDGEVIRFLISYYYNQKLKKEYNLQMEEAKKEYASEIAPMLSDFMEKYGDQWKRLGEDE
ncbi:MAG: hypothetical protein ACTSYI_09680, partial [Promethearchaeota archaeon]